MNDFDEIIDNINNNKSISNEFDKNNWKEQKQKERQAVYDLIELSIERIKGDTSNFKSYLDTQSRFDKYSVGNALLINAQMPNAIQLKEFDDWKDIGVYIKKHQNGIKILEPKDTYTRADGNSAISYNVKKLFDITQTTMSPKENIKNNNYDKKIILTALLKDCSVNIKAVDEIIDSNNIAELKKEDNTIYVKRGEEIPIIFKELAREIAKVELDEIGNNELNDFKSKSIAYMLGKKYGIDVSDIRINIPDEFKNMNSIQVRNELSSIRNAMETINNRMNSYFESISKKHKNKEFER